MSDCEWDWDWCPTCGTFANLKDDHVCPPAWEVANYAGEVERIVYGHDAERAACGYRETDADDWESGDEVEVSVRRKGEAKWHHFTVTRRCEPSFSASERESPPEGWEDPTEVSACSGTTQGRSGERSAS